MEQTIPIIEKELNHEQRLYDDVTTWLAETLDGSMRTPFTYSFDGRELYARDGGALGKVFDEAIIDAQKFPPHLAFESRRRLKEQGEYLEMIAMMKGDLPNTMVVVSDFPPELMRANRDVWGYNVARKQTMLRIITKNSDGTLSMRSQSLDGSNRQALEAIYLHCGYTPENGELLGQRMHIELDEEQQEFLIDSLTGVYDQSLAEIYGGTWRAGKQMSKYINTYDFVRAQSDLINVYIRESIKFGDNPQFLQDITATIHKRFEQFMHAPVINPKFFADKTFMDPSILLQEILSAGKDAIEKRKVYSGCGLTLGANNEELSVSGEMSELGFGSKTTEDKYGSLTFKCPKGHTNRRPINQLLDKCKTCGTSVRC